MSVDTGRGRYKAKQAVDMETMEEYRSLYFAGKQLAHLVGGDPTDRHNWYRLIATYPGRFKVRNDDGDLVDPDDPSVAEVEER